jgi:hypothetical protein
MSNPSPPGNGNGARQGAGPQNENDTKLLPDSGPVVNSEIRSVIKTAPGLCFFQIIGQRNRIRYEIVSGCQTWHFPLLYSAYNKWDRLLAKLGGNSRGK